MQSRQAGAPRPTPLLELRQETGAGLTLVARSPLTPYSSLLTPHSLRGQNIPTSVERTFLCHEKSESLLT